MMSRGTRQLVVLIDGQKLAAGEVRVERWERPGRLLRAAKRWAALWGLAALSILVPVAHFVLVPGFLIAGPIAALVRYRQQSGVLGGEGTCPACGETMTMDAHEDEWPLWEICPACRASVRIEKGDTSTHAEATPADMKPRWSREPSGASR